MNAIDGGTEPCGGVQPVSESPRRRGGCSIVSAVLGVLAGGAALVGICPMNTSGATRAARLQWQQRQADIERVIAGSAAQPQRPEEPAHADHR